MKSNNGRLTNHVSLLYLETKECIPNHFSETCLPIICECLKFSGSYCSSDGLVMQKFKSLVCNENTNSAGE